MRLVDLIESGNDNDVDAIKESYAADSGNQTDWRAVGIDVGNSIASVLAGRGLELADRSHLVGSVLKIFYPDVAQNATGQVKCGPLTQVVMGALMNSQLSENIMSFVNGINKG